MPEDFPKYLYKFRSFDAGGNYRKLLEKFEFYFPSPNKFNDPFDCRVFHCYELGSKSEIIQKMSEHIKQLYPDKSRESRRILVRQLFKENYTVIKNPRLMNSRIRDVINNSFGICSLTEDFSNLLMWSHYADSHRGFCIQVDALRLREITNKYFELLKDLIVFERVTYSETFPIVNPYIMNTDRPEDFFIGTITKSKEWSYEKEWRIVYYKQANLSVPFNNTITAVYFGCNCPDEKIREVASIVKNYKTPPMLFKAVTSPRQFLLQFEPISP